MDIIVSSETLTYFNTPHGAKYHETATLKKQVRKQPQSRAIFHAVSRRPLIRKACLQYRLSSCVMYISIRDFRRAFSTNSSVLSHQYHSTSVPQPYIFHATPTLQTTATDTAIK